MIRSGQTSGQNKGVNLEIAMLLFSLFAGSVSDRDAMSFKLTNFRKLLSDLHNTAQNQCFMARNLERFSNHVVMPQMDPNG